MGNLSLDMHSIGADAYVTNCHKWLYTPKGTALLWASRELQATLKPCVVSHGAGLGFVAEHWWSGTSDICNWLAVPSAVAVISRLGLANVRARNAAVLAKGVTILCNTFWCAHPNRHLS